MSAEKTELVREWLGIAYADLASAAALGGGTDMILSTALYHCQQCAEKSLKAMFIFHDIDPPKTHLLTLLLARIVAEDSRFTLLQDHADMLTPFATEYRHSGAPHAPTREEFSRAYAAADDVYQFVLSIMPPTIHP